MNGDLDPALRGAVLRAVTSVCPPAYRDQVSEQAAFADLGFDSLDRITLAAAAEDTTGRHVSDEALPGLRTVSDLLIHLSAQGALT